MTTTRAVRPVVCGLDGRPAEPLDDVALLGVHRAMRFYRSDDLIPRLLATIETLRGTDRT